MPVKAQQQDPPVDPLRTVRETCERLGVSHPTVYRLIRANKLKSLVVGRMRRIPESEIARFIADGLKEGL